MVNWHDAPDRQTRPKYQWDYVIRSTCAKPTFLKGYVVKWNVSFEKHRLLWNVGEGFFPKIAPFFTLNCSCWKRGIITLMIYFSVNFKAKHNQHGSDFSIKSFVDLFFDVFPSSNTLSISIQKLSPSRVDPTTKF